MNNIDYYKNYSNRYSWKKTVTGGKAEINWLLIIAILVFLALMMMSAVDPDGSKRQEQDARRWELRKWHYSHELSEMERERPKEYDN